MLFDRFNLIFIKRLDVADLENTLKPETKVSRRHIRNKLDRRGQRAEEG